MHPLAYVKIIRPGNAAMAAGAVLLGAWVGGSSLSLLHRILLAMVAAGSTGFGNIINDIRDIESDRISHPERPLPCGNISPAGAVVFASVLAIFSLSGAFYTGLIFGMATLLPLLLLVLYALRLKGTPLAGNALVSLLVAYSLIFGGIGAPRVGQLVIPAAMAMLLNFCREIVKDLQDDRGDRSTGITTSAMLPRITLKRILYLCSMLYGALLFLPSLLGHFGIVYITAVVIVVIPLHGFRLWQTMRPNWETSVARFSFMLKIEMLGGLAAMTLDRCVPK